MISAVFILLLCIVFYTYAGYAILIFFVNKFSGNNKKPPVPLEADLPSVSLVIPAYNEEKHIRAKINNSLSLNYPHCKLKIVCVTDGSTDHTNDIVQEYPLVQLKYSPERRGKVAAINRVMGEITSPFVVFTDANTFLNKNALLHIVKHYTDEKTGAVSGEKKVILNTGQNNAATEGVYWKYESFLKKQDSDFCTVVGAAGELFSIRTKLYEPVEEDTLLDDFMISLRICKKGYKVVYEPEAFALESPSADIREESKRKVRISAGGFQSMARLLPLLNPFKNPRLTFLYVSHRVLRWAVCPFILPLIFVLNGILVIQEAGVVYKMLFVLQCLVYVMALTGWMLNSSNRSGSIFKVPFYFIFMNSMMYMGLKKYLQQSQSVNWEKASRA